MQSRCVNRRNENSNFTFIIFFTKVHTMKIARRKGRMWTPFSFYHPKEIKWWLQLSISRVWASRTATRARTGIGIRCSDLTFWMDGTRRYKVNYKIFSTSLLLIHFQDPFSYFYHRKIHRHNSGIRYHKINHTSLCININMSNHSFSYFRQYEPILYRSFPDLHFKIRYKWKGGKKNIIPQKSLFVKYRILFNRREREKKNFLHPTIRLNF